MIAPLFCFILLEGLKALKSMVKDFGTGKINGSDGDLRRRLANDSVLAIEKPSLS